MKIYENNITIFQILINFFIYLQSFWIFFILITDILNSPPEIFVRELYVLKNLMMTSILIIFLLIFLTLKNKRKNIIKFFNLVIYLSILFYILFLFYNINENNVYNFIYLFLLLIIGIGAVVYLPYHIVNIVVIKKEKQLSKNILFFLITEYFLLTFIISDIILKPEKININNFNAIILLFLVNIFIIILFLIVLIKIKLVENKKKILAVINILFLLLLISTLIISVEKVKNKVKIYSEEKIIDIYKIRKKLSDEMKKEDVEFE